MADVSCNDSVVLRDDGSNLEHLAYAAASLSHSSTAAAEVPLVPTLLTATQTSSTMLMSSESTARNLLQPLSQFQPTNPSASLSMKSEYILPHSVVVCTESMSSSSQTLYASSSGSFSSLPSSNMPAQLLNFNNCSSNLSSHSVNVSSSQSSSQSIQNVVSSQMHQPSNSVSNFASSSVTPDQTLSPMYHCATPTSVAGISDPPSYVYISTEPSHQVGGAGASINTSEYGTTLAHTDIVMPGPPLVHARPGDVFSSSQLVNIGTVGDTGLPPLHSSCPTMTSTMQHQLPQSVFTTALRPSTNVLPTSVMQQTSMHCNNSPAAVEMPPLTLDSNYAVSLGSTVYERSAVETSITTNANSTSHRAASIPVSISDPSSGQYVRLTKANTSMLIPSVVGSAANQLGSISSQHLILHPSQPQQSFPLQASSSRSLSFINYATPNSSGTTYSTKGGQLLTIAPNSNTILVHPIALSNINIPPTSENVSSNQVVLRTYVQQPTSLIHDGPGVSTPTTCVQHQPTQGITINNGTFNVLGNESLHANEDQGLVHQSELPEQFSNNPYDLSSSPLPSRSTRQVQAPDSQAELYDQVRDLNSITPDFNPDQPILMGVSGSDLGSSGHHGSYELLSSYPESSPCLAVTNNPAETIVDGVRILTSVSETKIPMHYSSSSTLTTLSGGGEAIHYVDARGIEQQTKETCHPNSLPVARHGGHHTVDASAQTLPQGSFLSDSLVAYNTDAALMQEEKSHENVSADKKSVVEGGSQNPSQSRDRLVMAAEMPDPEPVMVDGKKSINCPLCDAVFSRMYLYKRHAIVHIGEKRGFLTMRNKIDIITRAKAGERHIDLAMEYNVGRSTLTAIIKNSQKYLDLEKGGNFSGERKRLRGAKREDVEEALYLWYRQALEMNLPISGPKLCQKAKDFSAKLGYKEFKATHGWLDRFKHRRRITLSRTKTIKESMASYSSSSSTLGDGCENQRDFASAVLPGLLSEFESNDVFYADEVGLLFTVLPDECTRYQGMRCSGGALSANRLTLLVCANMTSTEKFPLLVVGRYSKPQNSETLRSLPVQYFFNGKAWITQDHFNLWLTDIDSWFVKHNRKVLFLIPTSPVHPKNMSLNAIKIVTTPASFKGPVKQGISKALKQHYRRSVLELNVDNLPAASSNRNSTLVNSGASHAKKMHPVSLLQALVFLSSSWQNVSVTTITSSFTKAGFSKYGPWSVNAPPDSGLATDNLELLYCLRETGFSIPSSLTFNDYVTFDDDVQTCRLMDDEDVIAIVTKKLAPTSDSETELDSGEITPAEHKTNTVSNSSQHARASNSRCNNNSSSNKNNGNVPTVPPSPIQTKSLLHSLKVLQSHVQKKAAQCPELSPVFARLEELVLEKLVAKSRKDTHESDGAAAALPV